MTAIKDTFDAVTGKAAKKLARQTEEAQRKRSMAAQAESEKVRQREAAIKQKEVLRAAEEASEGAVSRRVLRGKRSLIRSNRLGG